MKESTLDNKKSDNKLTSIFLGIALVTFILIFFFWNSIENAEDKEIDPTFKEDMKRINKDLDRLNGPKLRIN